MQPIAKATPEQIREAITKTLAECGHKGEWALTIAVAKAIGVPNEAVQAQVRELCADGTLQRKVRGNGNVVLPVGATLPPKAFGKRRTRAQMQASRLATPDTPPETTPVDAPGVPQDGVVGVAAISTPPEQERGRDGQGVTFERLSEKEADEEILTQWGARASKIVPATLAHQNIPVGTIEDGALKDGRLAAPPGQGNAKSGLLPVPPRRWDTEVKLTPTGPRALTYLELTPSERFKIQFLKLVEEQGIEASEAVAPIGLPWAAPGPLLYRVGVALGLLDGSLVTKKEATS